jgi:hypothetical protein
MDDEAAQMRGTCKLSEGEDALHCDFFQLAIYPSDAKQESRQEVAKAADANLDRFCKVNSKEEPGDTPANKAKISAVKSACTQSDKARFELLIPSQPYRQNRVTTSCRSAIETRPHRDSTHHP